MFSDRTDAGRQLAARLAELHLESPIIYALPRGGVPVAVEVAKELHAPLDLLVVRKIGAPGYPEVAMGAVVDGDDPTLILNDDVYAATGRDAEALERARQAELAEVRRRRARYLGDRPALDATGRTVVIVDDGLATGATAKAALAGVRQMNAGRTVLAMPVAPAETLREMRALADDVVVLETPLDFWAIGQFYSDFHQLTDAETVRLLEQAWAAE